MKILNQSSIKPKTKLTGQKPVLWHNWHTSESVWNCLSYEKLDDCKKNVTSFYANNDLMLRM